VWGLRRQCRERALDGGPACEPDGDPHRSAARSAALDAVDAACNERQLSDLRFLGFFDSHADVTTFCFGWADTADSLTFTPLATASDAGARACALAAADAASDAMRYVFRARRRCMDRAAGLTRSSPLRPALLSGVDQGAARAVDRIVARLSARCPDLAGRAGRTSAALVDLLVARADCIGGAFYIQDAVVCPAAVCGNAVIEAPETCDDGNTADGDTCPSDCMR